MIEEKHLDPEAADRIGNFVRMSGGVELIDTLMTTDLVKPAMARRLTRLLEYKVYIIE